MRRPGAWLRREEDARSEEEVDGGREEEWTATHANHTVRAADATLVARANLDPRWM